jgi:hypothetical protein
VSAGGHDDGNAASQQLFAQKRHQADAGLDVFVLHALADAAGRGLPSRSRPFRRSVQPSNMTTMMRAVEESDVHGQEPPMS